MQRYPPQPVDLGMRCEAVVNIDVHEPIMTQFLAVRKILGPRYSPKVHSNAVSSRISRTAVCARVSPGSTLPFGMDQSLNFGRCTIAVYGTSSNIWTTTPPAVRTGELSDSWRGAGLRESVMGAILTGMRVRLPALAGSRSNC